MRCDLAAALPGSAEPSSRVFVFKSARSVEVGFLRRHAVPRAWTTLGGCVSLNPCVYGAFESELLHFHAPAYICQRTNLASGENCRNSPRGGRDLRPRSAIRPELQLPDQEVNNGDGRDNKGCDPALGPYFKCKEHSSIAAEDNERYRVGHRAREPSEHRYHYAQHDDSRHGSPCNEPGIPHAPRLVGVLALDQPKKPLALRVAREHSQQPIIVRCPPNTRGLFRVYAPQL